MATRFLALVSDDGRLADMLNPSAPCLADMTCVYAGRRMQVYVDRQGTVCQLGENGVVIGDLFERQLPYPRCASITAEAARRIVTTQGESLVRDFWGGYVACYEEPPVSTVHILRDPSRAMPCYYTHRPWGTALASDIETLHASGLLDTTIQWSFFPRHFAAGDLVAPPTAFAGLFDLLPGQRLSLTAGQKALAAVWSPWDYADATNLDADDAAAYLYEVVCGAVRAWAGAYPRPLVTVSGGLDSSIVACALAKAGVDMTCLNLTTDEALGDERAYARRLAACFGVRLHEASYRHDHVNLHQPSVPHLPRPSAQAFVQSALRIQTELAATAGTDSIFTGVGGDNVFCLMQSATPIVDRIKSGAGLSDVLATVDDVCALTGCSLWEAGQLAIRRLLRQRPQYRWRSDTSFLSANAIIDATANMDHAWLAAPPDALPGKAVHIALLTRLQATPDEFSRIGYGPQINPLSSQPVMELCLAIPSWQWCTGGVNRALARRAFAHDLPPDIVGRRSKGSPSSFAHDLVQAHRADLHERLCKGYLVEHNVLDSDALERLFNAPRPFTSTERMKVSDLAEAEEWVRHWRAVPPVSVQDRVVRP